MRWRWIQTRDHKQTIQKSITSKEHVLSIRFVSYTVVFVGISWKPEPKGLRTQLDSFKIIDSEASIVWIDQSIGNLSDYYLVKDVIHLFFGGLVDFWTSTNRLYLVIGWSIFWFTIPPVINGRISNMSYPSNTAILSFSTSMTMEERVKNRTAALIISTLSLRLFGHFHEIGWSAGTSQTNAIANKPRSFHETKLLKIHGSFW